MGVYDAILAISTVLPLAAFLAGLFPAHHEKDNFASFCAWAACAGILALDLLADWGRFAPLFSSGLAMANLWGELNAREKMGGVLLGGLGLVRLAVALWRGVGERRKGRRYPGGRMSAASKAKGLAALAGTILVATWLQLMLFKHSHDESEFPYMTLKEQETEVAMSEGAPERPYLVSGEKTIWGLGSPLKKRDGRHVDGHGHEVRETVERDSLGRVVHYLTIKNIAFDFCVSLLGQHETMLRVRESEKARDQGADPRWHYRADLSSPARPWTPAALSASENAPQDAWLLDPRDRPAEKHCQRHFETGGPVDAILVLSDPRSYGQGAATGAK